MDNAGPFPAGREPGSGGAAILPYVPRLRAAGRSRPARLLLADDTKQRGGLAAALHRLGAEVVLATHGEEALDHLETGIFDAVLLDLATPGFDTAEVTKLLRFLWIDGPHVPVLAFSATVTEAWVESCLAASVDAWLPRTAPAVEIALTLQPLLDEPAPRGPGPLVSARPGEAGLAARQVLRFH